MRLGVRSGRRESQATGFTPCYLGNCILWLRADSGITVSTGVSAWNDQSGNGNNFAQATGTAQPAFNATDSNFNGKPTLGFTGTSSQVLNSSAAIAQAQAFTMVVACRVPGTTNQGLVFSSAGTVGMYVPSGGGTQMTAGTGLAAVNGVTSASVYCAVFNGNSSAIYVNTSQTAGASGPGGSGALASTMAIGSEIGSAFLTGTIAEVVVYSTALTAAQRYLLFQYMGNRYGIATS